MMNLRPHEMEKLGGNQKGPSFYTQDHIYLSTDTDVMIFIIFGIFLLKDF